MLHGLQTYTTGNTTQTHPLHTRQPAVIPRRCCCFVCTSGQQTSASVLHLILPASASVTTPRICLSSLIEGAARRGVFMQRGGRPSLHVHRWVEERRQEEGRRREGGKDAKEGRDLWLGRRGHLSSRVALVAKSTPITLHPLAPS